MAVGTISSTGIGSGLDVNSIVTQLMALERKPLDKLEEDKSRLDTQLSTLGKIQSSLSAMRDAARTLTDASTWNLTKVASSDETMVGATGTGEALPGNYSVDVTQLAASQMLASKTVPGPTYVVGTGTLTIEMGRWFTDPPDFTPTVGASSVSIEITAADNTLEKIRDKINAAGAGVHASIVNDASGARLALRSVDSGATNGFRVTVADDDGNATDANGLSMFAYDPAGSGTQMTLAQAAQNAKARINGIPVETTGNTLTEVLDGLTVNLARKTDTPVELTVARDADAIKKAITDFATAYNGLVSLMRTQTAYNPDTKSGATLQGNSTVLGILGRLRGIAGGNSGATTEFTRLTDIGLEPQRDGTLKVNDSKLTSAVGRLDELKVFFSRNEDGTDSDGVGTMLREFADFTLSSDGALTTHQEGMRKRIEQLDKRGDKLEERIASTEVRLREQYQRLDTNLAQLNALQAYITQQITLWNRSASSR
jgi:flagellar hook-associated protein 2